MSARVEKVGSFLKERRLRLGFSLELVSEKTKINATVIKKIEEGESIPFLADVHLRGFIKNFCEVYEADSEEALRIYEEENISAFVSNRAEEKEDSAQALEQKNAKVHENKTPPSQKQNWIEKAFWFFGRYSALTTGVVLILGIFFSFLYFYRRPSLENVEASIESENKEAYKMNSVEASFDLKLMDVVRIFFNSKYYVFTFRDYRGKTIFFTVDTFSYQLDEDNTANIDMNGDGINDLLVNFKKGNGDLVYIYFKLLDERAIDYDSLWETSQKVLVGYERTLLSYRDKEPINVYIKATKLSSYLSYIIDGSRQGNLTLSPGKDTNIYADDALEISIGNYKSVRMFVNQIPLNLSLDHDKFSLTKVVKWIKDPNNETKSDLVIKDYVEKVN